MRKRETDNGRSIGNGIWASDHAAGRRGEQARPWELGSGQADTGRESEEQLGSMDGIEGWFPFEVQFSFLRRWEESSLSVCLPACERRQSEDMATTHGEEGGAAQAWNERSGVLHSPPVATEELL